AGRDLAWPSITTDGNGKLWINYARGGATECLAAYTSVVQPGEQAAASILIKPGSGRYEFSPGEVERWGDYTAVARDPVTPTRVATYGAYAFNDGGGAVTQLWRQVIASVEDT
ncbi:MAG TPA: hypothetical protein VF036_02930, partial [Actinomycetota bacterium]